MARKRDTAEQIIGKRREAEGVRAQGDPVAQGARRRGVTEQTASRGRREAGGRRACPCDPSCPSRSGGPVGCAPRRAARRGARPGWPRMHRPGSPGAARGRGGSGAPVPGASRPCCARRAAGCPASPGGAAGRPTAPARGAAPRGPTTSGPTPASANGRTTGGHCGCTPAWTRTRGRASASLARAACGPTTSWARLTARFVRHGPPSSLRSDTGPEFTATAVRSCLRRLGDTPRFIEPGSPWENGAVEACNGKLRDECLNPEIFTTRTKAQVLIERWRRAYTQGRPHSALGSRPRPPRTRWRSDCPTSRPGQSGGFPSSPRERHNDRGQVTLPRHQNPAFAERGSGVTGRRRGNEHPRRTPALRLLSSPAYLRARESRWDRRTCLQRHRRAVLRWPRGLLLLRHGL